MRILGDAAAAYATAGYFTIVEGIITPGRFLGPLCESLRAAGHNVACAVLRAPLAVCESRARSRESQPLANREVLARLWHDFADLGPLEPNAIEMARRAPAKQPTCSLNALKTGCSRPEARQRRCCRSTCV